MGKRPSGSAAHAAAPSQAGATKSSTMAVCRTDWYADLIDMMAADQEREVGWTEPATDILSRIACSSAALNSSSASNTRDCRMLPTSALLRAAVSERMFEFA